MKRIIINKMSLYTSLLIEKNIQMQKYYFFFIYLKKRFLLFDMSCQFS